MASKRFILIALAFAMVLLVASEIAAAKELTSNHESEVEEAKYGHDRGYYNGGRGGYYHGGGRGRGGYYNGRGRGRGYCRYGCCGGGRYYNGGCRCCGTLAEATAYKQAHEAHTHN